MKLFLFILVLSIFVFLTVFWYWIAHRSFFSGDWRRVKSPLILFDFDGTICLSYPLFIEQVNSLADEYRLRKIGEDETEAFRNMTPQSIMKKLGVSFFKLPFLLNKARQNVQQQLLELKPVAGIVEILQELKRRKVSLGILTSNSLENVLLYLQEHKIDFFDFVYAGNNVFGKEKRLKRILEKTHLDPRKDLVIYVGDEVRDIEAAQKAHFTSIAVTWGYNSLPLLQESSPDFLSEAPSSLLAVINTAISNL